MVGVDHGRTSGGQTDVAALGSGVVGVAVSILIQPGAFGLLVAIVAVTLGFVIVSYIGSHKRNLLQRIAFALVMALIAIPLVGVTFERNNLDEPSSVSLLTLLIGWFIAGIVTFCIDSVFQRRADLHSL